MSEPESRETTTARTDIPAIVTETGATSTSESHHPVEVHAALETAAPAAKPRIATSARTNVDADAVPQTNTASTTIEQIGSIDDLGIVPSDVLAARSMASDVIGPVDAGADPSTIAITDVGDMPTDECLEFHPLADIVPLYDATQLALLARDIVANGLREPIVMYDGKILDGRNRFLACKDAGVPFQSIEMPPGDPVAYEVSRNVIRRNLNDAQRAMAAARLANLPLGQSISWRGCANWQSR
jgi:hypothetical protein